MKREKRIPLQVLGCLIVRERVKKHMGRLFVQVVANACGESYCKW